MTIIDPSTATADDTPGIHLLRFRHELTDRILIGLSRITYVALPLSVSRSLFTGWLPVYTVHVSLAIVVLFAHWYRARLSDATKASVLIGLLWSVGLMGLFTFGMLGTGYWWLVVSSLLVSTLYSVRAGIVVAVAVVVVLMVAAFVFTSGIRTIPLDANAYVVSKVAWAGLLAATLTTPFIVFSAVAAYQQTTVDLLHKVHAQRVEIERLATHDQLTGLPSLTLASDRLQMALNAAPRLGKKVAVLFLDLDGFKAVNDAFGHEVGDEVLKEVAKRLSASIRVEDTAARIGGDEFIVILGGLIDGKMASVVAGRAITAITRPIDHAGHSIAVGVSIGIALFPDHAKDAQALRRIADAAMYTVKRSGKNSFAFGEPG